MLGTIKNYLRKKVTPDQPKPSSEAYDLWSDSYDRQPGNLMLDLDEIIFTDLLKDVDITNKVVADIGCGTGRHWQKIYAKSPAMVKGYDVSEGMLRQLKIKFPSAITSHITDNRLADTLTASIDCIISTLTIAHIENLEETIATWARILKPGGNIILTDFHPDTLAKGGRRTFKHGDQSVEVINFVHPVRTIEDVCKKYGIAAERKEERYVDDRVKHYYESQHAMHVYNQFKGLKIIYGLHLKKGYVAH
ncbi:MAG: methyltransferase domain-containing protein [Ferruginibacter sp.]